MGLAEGVLDGEPRGLVDERERRHPFLVLDPGAEAHVLVPVLVLVLGVGRGQHHGAVADGQAVVLVGAAEDLEHLVRPRRRGSRLVVVVVPEPRHPLLSSPLLSLRYRCCVSDGGARRGAARPPRFIGQQKASERHPHRPPPEGPPPQRLAG